VNRLHLDRIETEIAPLLSVHGVELVALEWFQGPGHGILRITIDQPDGDPRVTDPTRGVSLEQVTDVTRDVSTALDALDLIDEAYTLEVGSPGPERPVQRRRDFDRFVGLRARIDTRAAGARSNLSGVLRGTRDGTPAEGFVVRLETAPDVEREVPARTITRARLHAIAAPARAKPGNGPSRRQERLAAREKARAINAAHQVARQAEQAAGATTPATLTVTAPGAAEPARNVKR
jgi:ribosome maturation factor RimP